MRSTALGPETANDDEACGVFSIKCCVFFALAMFIVLYSQNCAKKIIHSLYYAYNYDVSIVIMT